MEISFDSLAADAITILHRNGGDNQARFGTMVGAKVGHGLNTEEHPASPCSLGVSSVVEKGFKEGT
jgi:hypothetical protein